VFCGEWMASISFGVFIDAHLLFQFLESRPLLLFGWEGAVGLSWLF
jgi:hypothetical protein